ncbi:MAG: hypothetical protein OEZ08_19420 [Betaproteobacteria bacterium]|nr:hypothetical protein [Betaproteobacteria bacterium]
MIAKIRRWGNPSAVAHGARPAAYAPAGTVRGSCILAQLVKAIPHCNRTL